MVSDLLSRLKRWLVVLTMGAGLAAAPSAAQTLFQWPDTAVDIARYATVEQCLALAERTRTRYEYDSLPDAWIDSIPLARRAMAPAPRVVTAKALRCAAQFQARTADLADYHELLKLFLLAGRDTDAAALVARQVGAATTAAARETAVDTAVDTYLNYARPIRLAAATALLRARVRTLEDPSQRLQTYMLLLLYQSGWDDTAAAHETAQTMLSLYSALTAVEREEVRARLPAFDGMAFYVTSVYLGRDVFLDSLRRSTAAYVELIQDMWTRSTGEHREALGLPVGRHAPIITADFWFPADSGRTARPAPGRVTLVEFLGTDMAFRWPTDPEYNPYGGAWLEHFVRLRRLAERFPALQIILVAETRGSFVYDTMPTPAVEAEWIHRAVQANQAPPGALLAVSSTPNWRLPVPDRRRLNRLVPNDTAYAFGDLPVGEGVNAVGGRSGGAVNVAEEILVDQDGLVVAAASPGSLGLGRTPLDRMIDALLHRGRSTGGSATPGLGGLHTR